MAKQIIIEDQAAPKTHPSGSHGALVKLEYHSEVPPSPERIMPKYRLKKLIIKNNKVLKITF